MAKKPTKPKKVISARPAARRAATNGSASNPKGPKTPIESKLRKEFRELCRTIEPPADPKAPTAEEIKKQLRLYHELGKLVNRSTSGLPQYRAYTSAELAKLAGRKSGWVSKIRKFAKVYDKKGLAKLCKLAHGIQWGHVQLLITVPNPKERYKLQNQIVEHGWTHLELSHEIAAKPGSRHWGGRPAKVPASARAALLRLVADSKQWRKRCEAAVAVIDAESGKKLDAERKKLTVAAGDALQGVERRAKAAVKRLVLE